jgi:hypothetical protein
MLNSYLVGLTIRAKTARGTGRTSKIHESAVVLTNTVGVDALDTLVTANRIRKVGVVILYADWLVGVGASLVLASVSSAVDAEVGGSPTTAATAAATATTTT